MSHFTVGVLIPPGVEDVEGAVEKMLAPFDENLDSPPYFRTCYCVGRAARKTARETALEENGYEDFQDVRDAFAPVRQKIIADAYDSGEIIRREEVSEEDIPAWIVARGVIEDRIDVEWKSFIAPVIDREKELFESSMLIYAADPECDECSGTGRFLTTYNLLSKWDWYRIGGRWAGEIVSQERAKELETDDGFNFSTPENVRDNSAWCSELLERDELFSTYSLVVPPKREDDETHPQRWIESGSMGWWGISTNEVGEQEWEQTVREVYQEYSDHLLVVVDCHI